MPTHKIEELRGATPWLSAMLRGKGIEDTATLLARAGQREQRRALAAAIGVDERHILELCHRADLMRIRGIGRVYADLLEFAGVDTVMELAQRDPEHLYARLLEVAGRHTVRRLPRRQAVHDWVAQAGSMERKVTC